MHRGGGGSESDSNGADDNANDDPPSYPRVQYRSTLASGHFFTLSHPANMSWTMLSGGTSVRPTKHHNGVRQERTVVAKDRVNLTDLPPPSV